METTTTPQVCDWSYGSATNTKTVTDYVTNQLAGTDYDAPAVEGSFRDALYVTLPGGIRLDGETFKIHADIDYFKALWAIYSAVRDLSVLNIAMTFHPIR